MGRRSPHHLPPGIHRDKHGVYWATLVDEDAKEWRRRNPGKTVPRRRARTQTEARRLQRKLQDNLKAGLNPPANNPLLGDYLTNWLAGKHSLKPNSYLRYEKFIRYQVLPLPLARIRLQEITADHVQQWVNALVKLPYANRPSQTIGASTIDGAFRMLRAALSDAAAKDKIPKNPCKSESRTNGKKHIERPDLPDDKPKPLTPSEVKVFFQMLEKYNKNGPHPNEALYHIAIKCGLRPGELYGLLWDDIDLKRRTLHVTGQLSGNSKTRTLKTKKAYRTVPIPRTLVLLLERHKENQRALASGRDPNWNPENHVFCTANGTPFQANNIHRQFQRLLKRAGLAPRRVHDLRHTYAAIAIAAEVDPYTLSRRMGHQSIKTTFDFYGHLYVGSMQDADTIETWIAEYANDE